MKTIRIQPSFRRLALAISAFTVLALSSRAFADAGIYDVTAGNITGGNTFDFTVAQGPYQLNDENWELGNYGNNGGNGPGLIDSTNFGYLADNSVAPPYTQTDGYLGALPGDTTADLILGFDFSGSGYTPTALTFNANTIDFGTAATYTYEYSTDGFTYTPFATVSNTFSGSPESTAITGDPSQVYVEIAISDPSGFVYSHTELGRSAVDTAALDYSFTVAATPEPSTFALVGLGLAIFAFGVVRRAKAISI